MALSSSEYLLNFLKKRQAKTNISNESCSQEKRAYLDNEIRNTENDNFVTHPLEEVKVQLMTKSESFIHEVALSPKANSLPILEPIDDWLVKYPFKLDPFQERAVRCIHNKHSIVVSAHTSAGKTVVAEYGIARALHDRQRIIYTTPIKALSNQKYHDFVKRYGYDKVGLLTGDVSTNVDADIIVMTAEILRLMIYHGSPITREVGWVVFDEVHYMRDASRGYVWEEIISLLPWQVRLICLSATIPNAAQLAQWIVYLHCDTLIVDDRIDFCHVISTEYRPVPLEHYLCNSFRLGNITDEVNPEFKLVVDDESRFQQETFNSLIKEVEDSQNLDGESSRNNNDECESVRKVVKYLLNDKRDPILVFTFSKSKAERLAIALKKKLKITSKLQRKQIKKAYLNLLAGTLCEQDVDLPQITEMLSLLRCGIAYHHSGLLPAVKEAIEILFSNNALAVVIATETFAMGLNMPARSVIFADLQKYDGRCFRWLTPSEYIQMSGRSGRRGTDKLGTVIVMVKPERSRGGGANNGVGLLSLREALQSMLTGNSEPIRSSFRLTYHTILNFMRMPDVSIHRLIRRTLFHIQSLQEKIPLTKKACTFLQEEVNKLNVYEDEEQFIRAEHFLQISSLWSTARNQLWNALLQNKDCQKLFTVGRFIETLKYGWVLLLKVGKSDYFKNNGGTKAQFTCLVPFIKFSQEVNDECISQAVNLDRLQVVVPNGLNDSSITLHWTIMKITESQIVAISQLSIAIDHKKLSRWINSPACVTMNLSKWNELTTSATFQQNNLDPWIALNALENSIFEQFLKVSKDRDEYRQQIVSLSDSPQGIPNEEFAKTILLNSQRKLLLKLIDKQQKQLNAIYQRQDLQTRINVLQQMKYCDNRELLTLKGRVACEISVADECDSIVLTELLLDQFFHDLTALEIVAVLSCFTMEHRLAGAENVASSKVEVPFAKKQQSDNDTLQKRLDFLFNKIKDKAKQVFEIIKQNGVSGRDDNSNDYVDRFRPTLMWPSYQWAKGKSFVVCTHRNPELHEGSVVRAIRSLHELLQHMERVAQVITSHELAEKFSEASKAIYRDTVFGKSLWSVLVEPVKKS